MNLFLQADADGSVCANDFIGANAGFGRHIPVWVGNSHVRRIIANTDVCALYGGLDQSRKKLLVCRRNRRWLLRGREPDDQQQEKKCDLDRVSHREKWPRAKSYQVFTR
jgi:hypothetical protein